MPRSTGRGNTGTARAGIRRGNPAGLRQIRTGRQARDYYDYNLLAAVILLTCFGLVMLYSTSAYEASVEWGSDTYYFGKQALISIVSFVGLIIGSQIDYHRYIRLSGYLYLVSVILLILTRFIGTTVNGARRWIYLGPVSFQPAELAKLAIILYLPYIIVHMLGYKKPMKKWAIPVTVLGLGAFSAFCTFFFTDNLSTAIIIMGIAVVLLFIVDPKTIHWLIITGIGAAVVAAAVLLVIPRLSGSGDFRISRIQVWLHPEDYASSGGYQVMQALYAIGSGGLFGKGLGNSVQKLQALPEAQNDMIFSIICEELGIFGALIVIFLFVFLLYRLFFIASNAPDLMGSLIASGIFVHISLQLVLNIAVVINMIPTTGITLPFVSYGGTSILFLMAEMMVALSISKQITFR